MGETQDRNLSERRQQERLALDSDTFLSVYRQEDHALLGHIVDISLGGMMLINQQPVAPGQSFRLLLEIGFDANQPRELTVAAKSVWSRKNPNPGLFDNGFQFIEIPDATRLAIKRLIDTLKAL